MKEINISLTQEEFKTIMVSIIARQQSLKLRMQKYGHNNTGINELDELDKLFNKILIPVDK